MIIEYEELRTAKPRSGDKILSCLRHFTLQKKFGYNPNMPSAF
jgi:hypothetical protein